MKSLRSLQRSCEPAKVRRSRGPDLRKRKVFSGEAVRAMRQGAGLTQADLARRLQISPSYLNQIEHNQRALTAGVLLELARVFRVDPQSFGDDEPNRLLLALRDSLADPALGGERCRPPRSGPWPSPPRTWRGLSCACRPTTARSWTVTNRSMTHLPSREGPPRLRRTCPTTRLGTSSTTSATTSMCLTPWPNPAPRACRSPQAASPSASPLRWNATTASRSPSTATSRPVARCGSSTPQPGGSA
ncbi:helix-turn-helix domain-containing protein [Rubellimicrobium mesophilum]|uniref:helix-turn-helix domain-containing protein n=1 Tax=Rubellimicrobium mesophilum TaxID=1123067 RepID=UPI003CCBD055